MFSFVGRTGGWVKGLFGKAAQSVSLISPYLRSVVWSLKRDFAVLARDAYGGNSAVYACLRVLSTSVPEPPLLAYTLDAKENKEPLAFDHPLMQLIRQPNPLQTEYEFWELVTLHTGIVGRSHWWKQRDRVGRVMALWPLRPDRVSPKYAEIPKNADGTDRATSTENAMRVLEGWAYWQPGILVAQILPANDVLTFNFPDPAGESGGLVEGLGPLQVIAREAEVDNEMTAFSAALLRNSATPGVILSVKQQGLSRADAKDIKRNFQAQFGGSNRGEPAVVDGDTVITQMGFSLSQLEYPSMRNFTESRISAAFGIPAILAQLNVGITAGIKATIDEQREYFAETTLSNLWRRFSDQYTLDVSSEFGDGIVCQFDLTKVKALAAQQAAESVKISDGFVKGAVTVDEYRDKVLHLAPIGGEFGESVYLPSMVTPTPTTDEFVKQPPSEIGSDEAISQQRQLLLLGDGTAKGRRLKAAMVDAERDADEDNLRAALAELFDNVQDDIARRIRAREYISDDDLAAAFLRLGPMLEGIYVGAMLRLGAIAGVQYDPAVISVQAAGWAATYVPQMIQGLTETTRAVVTSAVNEYRQTPGMTQADLRLRLSPAFGTHRAGLIASTETTRASSQAFSAYQARLADDGIAMHRIFRTNHDDRTCVACAPLNGKPESEWPEQYTAGPPLHVGCRCSVSLELTPTKSVGLVRVA